MQEIKIDEDLNERIDKYLTDKLDVSRSKISKMLKSGSILVNGKEIKNSYLLKNNDIISIDEYKEEDMDVVPEKMDLDIVYEDDDVIVVNKANGVVVHPAIGNAHGTLVNGLLYYSKNLSSININNLEGLNNEEIKHLGQLSFEKEYEVLSTKNNIIVMSDEARSRSPL